MQQKISGFHQDFENHWVAELECGHGQHVRHDPPWMIREWVLSPEERQLRIGTELNCVRCDELGTRVAEAVLNEAKKNMIRSYEDAGVSGLCQEGRWELALESLKTLNIPSIIDTALRIPSKDV